MHAVHPGSRLREAMSRGTVLVPGSFNALVARAVARAGFEATYISGGATANVAGYPDIGLITLSEMCRTIREISDASGLPVIADADTGFGEVECAIRTVVDYERAGAAALHLEDQVFPKRCGHLDGKDLVSAQDMADKVAAMAARRLSRDFVIIARTDARHVTGFDDMIARANLYREAGADVIFPEGLHDADEFARFMKASPGATLANMTEFGKTKYLTEAEFRALGVAIVIYPLSLMRIAMKSVEDALVAFRRDGGFHGTLEEMQSRKELYELLAYKPGDEWRFPANRA
jgi:methylisocitrate lyase